MEDGLIRSSFHVALTTVPAREKLSASKFTRTRPDPLPFWHFLWGGPPLFPSDQLVFVEI